MKKEYKDNVKDLCQAIKSLKSCEEIEMFLEDLCTINELQEMSQRYQVAKLLYANENYASICGKVGASTATISRVKKCLDYGNGGYKNAIERGK